MEKKLQRIPYEGAIAGVCAGLGQYFNLDKTWVRLAFILSVFFAGYGIGLLGPIVYVVLWIVLPVKAVSFPTDPFNVDYRTTGDHPTADLSAFESSETGRKRKKPKDRYVAGIILLMIGLFFLLRQLNVFYWNDFARFWPVAIMLLGVALLINSFNGNNQQTVRPPAEEEDRDNTTTSDKDSAGNTASDIPNHNNHE